MPDRQLTDPLSRYDDDPTPRDLILPQAEAQPFEPIRGCAILGAVALSGAALGIAVIALIVAMQR